MSKIDTFLEKIKTAIYGKDVRDAIHDSIRMCYTDAEKAVETANASSSTANNAISAATAASSVAKATSEKLNSIRFETDKTLRNSDYPADAKATGDAIHALGSRLDNFKSETDKTLQNADYPADAKTTGDAIRNIQATLSELTYKAITISGFKSNHPTNEIGSIFINHGGTKSSWKENLKFRHGRMNRSSSSPFLLFWQGSMTLSGR